MITSVRTQVEQMDQKRYAAAEAAFQKYSDSTEIAGELLLAWFLSEVHFADTVTRVLSSQLDAWPETELEKTLVIRIAHVYREIRKDAYRAEQVKPKGDMHAVRPKEP
jgi:hypothetical protein